MDPELMPKFDQSTSSQAADNWFKVVTTPPQQAGSEQDLYPEPMPKVDQSAASQAASELHSKYPQSEITGKQTGSQPTPDPLEGLTGKQRKQKKINMKKERKQKEQSADRRAGGLHKRRASSAFGRFQTEASGPLGGSFILGGSAAAAARSRDVRAEALSKLIGWKPPKDIEESLNNAHALSMLESWPSHRYHTEYVLPGVFALACFVL